MNRYSNRRLDADVESIRELPQIDMILKLLARTTNLKIALVARVSEAGWTACAVHDMAGFGMKPGDTLDVATTY